MNNRLKKGIFAIIICIVLTLPTFVFAKRGGNYVPPPFTERLLSSFITIVPCMVFISLAAYFLIRMFDKEINRNRKIAFICIVTVFIIASSIWSAMDAINEEGWNPALEGSKLAALIFPVSVLLLNRKTSFIKRLIIAVLLVVPSYWLSLLIINNWQNLGMLLGLPTTW